MKKSKQIKLQRLALDVCAIKLRAAFQDIRSYHSRCDTLAKQLNKHARTIRLQRAEISNLQAKNHNKQELCVEKVNDCITLRGIIEDQNQEIDDLKEDVQNLVERDGELRSENDVLRSYLQSVREALRFSDNYLTHLDGDN